MSEQFFSVDHSIPINVELLAEDDALPTPEQLEQELPEPFRLAGAVSHVDLHTAHQLRSQSDELAELVDVINQQASKLNLLLSFVLRQFDDPAQRRFTRTFGGSQLSFINPDDIEPGRRLRLKLFLSEEAAAVYCYGEVTESHPTDAGVLISVRYLRIRHQDQEALVRASLHIQSRQLRQRAEQRAQHQK